MWDMRRNLETTPLPERRSVIQFQYADAPQGHRLFWLIARPEGGGDVDLCEVDPGFDVGLYVSCSLRTMTAIWMGYETVGAALAAKKTDAGWQSRSAIQASGVAAPESLRQGRTSRKLGKL